MSISCKKHLKTPYRGYCPCAACELEKKDEQISNLRAEADQLKNERRSDALAGQAVLDESNNEVVRLKAEVEKYKGKCQRAHAKLDEWRQNIRTVLSQEGWIDPEDAEKLQADAKLGRMVEGIPEGSGFFLNHNEHDLFHKNGDKSVWACGYGKIRDMRGPFWSETAREALEKAAAAA